ncbi:CUB and peptidase domain-containing protein 2-like [Panonychus citri]|uniref:CUB and peptidase domain-containing protein 2-like n=1 Tax=Panonychus citri TaxID=50023 RepID=UPI002307A472|nr:CUB and peptidase domain-containing protein 2-like [Panonychus citri]
MRVLILLSFLITFNQSFNCLSIAPDSICNKDVPYILTEPSGHIYSPGYLSNQSYSEGLDCKWSILIPDGQYLTVKFEDLDLDESLGCDDDSLSFYGSSLAQEALVQRVCGTWKPKDLTVSEISLLKIEFVSDYIFSGRGFHISWTTSKNYDKCSNQEFRCFSGECVPRTLLCNGKYECTDGSDERGCKKAKLPKYECGKQKIKPDTSGFTDRILGGDPVIPGSWPWQADLQARFLWPSGHYCGGALIHPQYVLTAAHCAAAVTRSSDIRVVLGNHNSFKNDGTEQTRSVDSVTQYGDIPFQVKTGDFDHINDLAMMKLSVPVEITDAVNPICLADSKTKLTKGTKCFVTGWGATRGTGSSGILKQIIVEIDDINACSKSMGDAEEVDTSSDSQICIKVGGHGLGVCSGDSGGPLVCQVDDTWYLFGIASMVTTGTILGPVCGDKDGNAVYANVRAKISWIKETME